MQAFSFPFFNVPMSEGGVDIQDVDFFLSPASARAKSSHSSLDKLVPFSGSDDRVERILLSTALSLACLLGSLCDTPQHTIFTEYQNKK